MFKISNKSFVEVLYKYSGFRCLARHESNLAQKPLIYSSKSSQSIRENEEIFFDKTFHKILGQISDNTPNDNDLTSANQWLKKCIEYNVPKGKRNRGLMAVISYHLLAKDEDKTIEKLE